MAVPVLSAPKPETPPGFYTIGWSGEVGYAPAIQRIDTATGQGTIVSILQLTASPGPGYPDLFPSPFGLAFDTDGTMYTINNWISGDPAYSFSRFAKVNTLTGELAYVGPIYPMHFAGPAIDGCGDFYVTGFTVGDPATGGQPPIVYGDSFLYRFNKRTGEAIRIGDTGKTNWMDLAFDSKGRLWATTMNELWQIDPATAEASFVTAIHGVPSSDIPGVCPEDWPYMEVMTIAFDERDELWGTAIRGFSTCDLTGQVNAPVMRIDTQTGMATVVGHTNQTSYNHGGEMVPTRPGRCRRTD